MGLIIRDGNRWINSGVVLRIPGTNIKLNHRTIRKSRDGQAKQTVSGQSVSVRAVIMQGCRQVILRRVRPINQIGSQTGFLFIDQSRGDLYPARGARHDRPVTNLKNHRRSIRVQYRIGRPRRAFLHGASRPVLSMLVGDAWVYEF